MGKKLAKQFSQKHTNDSKKNVGKKSSQKSEKKRFLYRHEYRDKKMGGKKTRERIFPETHE